MAVFGIGFTATVTSNIFLAGLLNIRTRYMDGAFSVFVNILPFIFLIHAVLKMIYPNALFKTIGDMEIWSKLKNQNYSFDMPKVTSTFVQFKNMNRTFVIKYSFIIVSIIINFSTCTIF